MNSSHSTAVAPTHPKVVTTTTAHEPSNEVLTTLSVMGVIAIVLSMAGLMCYREISRRRIEAGIVMEQKRKERLRKSIRDKVDELQQCEQEVGVSYMDAMELKVPLVSFGKVTVISPVASTESMQSTLDMHLHHHHHHHYHHHHHFHNQEQEASLLQQPAS